MIIYTKPLQVDQLINEELPLKSEIFIADRYGYKKRQLTNTPVCEIFVKWMNDGKNIITEIVQHPERENYYFESYNLLLKKEAGK
jgi:Tol biopolymer transport system component